MKVRDQARRSIGYLFERNPLSYVIKCLGSNSNKYLSVGLEKCIGRKIRDKFEVYLSNDGKNFSLDVKKEGGKEIVIRFNPNNVGYEFARIISIENTEDMIINFIPDIDKKLTARLSTLVDFFRYEIDPIKLETLSPKEKLSLILEIEKKNEKELPCLKEGIVDLIKDYLIKNSSKYPLGSDGSLSIYELQRLCEIYHGLKSGMLKPEDLIEDLTYP